jgi:hypothetical protein
MNRQKVSVGIIQSQRNAIGIDLSLGFEASKLVIAIGTIDGRRQLAGNAGFTQLQWILSG